MSCQTTLHIDRATTCPQRLAKELPNPKDHIVYEDPVRRKSPGNGRRVRWGTAVPEMHVERSACHDALEPILEPEALTSRGSRSVPHPRLPAREPRAQQLQKGGDGISSCDCRVGEKTSNPCAIKCRRECSHPSRWRRVITVVYALRAR
eukprot:scaffold161338_cov31-Tisochrysis_lutea.AAC.1